MKSRNVSRRPSSRDQQRRKFLRWFHPTKDLASSRKLMFEPLEGRALLASLYVDNPGDFIITTDQGAPGLDNGDTVTFNPSGGTQLPQAGLIFGTRAFGTIQGAVTAANPTDTINVGQGTFSELVNVNKQLTLRGNQFGVDGQAAGRAAALPATETVVNGNAGTTSFLVTANGVVLDGFTVQGQTNVNQFGAGIVLGAGTNGSQVLNNIVQNNVVGLFLSNNSGVTPTIIQRNLFRNNNNPGAASGTGIYSDQFVAGGALTNVLIDNNTFTGNADAALDLSSTLAGSQSNITFSNNISDGNGRTLVFFNVVNSAVTGNEMRNSTSAASADIRIFEGVNNLSITNNLMQNGAGRGLRVSNIGTGASNATNITFGSNSISGYAGNGLELDAGGYTGLFNAQNNWWGSPTGPTTPSNPGGTGEEIVDPDNLVSFSPFYPTGADAQPGVRGFQPTGSPTGTTIVGTGFNDLLVITATSINGGTYQLTSNGVPGPVTPFANATSFSFAGLGGNDILRVNNPAGGLFAPALGIFYDGGTQTGAPGDSLEILGGQALNETINFLPDSAGSQHNGTIALVNGATTANYSYAGLSPVLVNAGTPTDIIFNLPTADGDNQAILEDDGVAGNGLSQVRSGNGTFETTVFADPTGSLTLNTGNDGETVTLAALDSTFAAATIQISGGTASDIFNVLATPAATSTTVSGNGGTDYFNNLASLNLDAIAGPLTLDGGAGGSDVARLQDSADAGPDTVTFDRTSPTVGTIAGAAGNTITYTNLEVLLFESTAAGDTINVLATLAGTNYYVTGNGGGDTVTIGNQTADFNSTFDGSLDNILGDILVTGEFNPASSAVDTLNVDDSGTVAPNIASIAVNPAFAFPLPAPAPGGTDLGAATELTGFAPAVIRYRQGNSTFLFPGTNAMEFVNVLSGQGNDTISVAATTATNTTTIDARQGNDTLTITGDNLSAANVFRGFDGNDQFNLNIAANIGATAFAPIASVQIEGNNAPGGAASDTVNRDRLTINDSSVSSRQLSYSYNTALPGGVNVGATVAGAGLFGGAAGGLLPLQVRTMETVIFNDLTGTNNDLNQVVGTTANDLLTVALRNNNSSALAFLGGTPYLDTLPVTIANSRPGVAGGGSGPDLSINGISPAAGITLNGGGIPAGGGDRAIVYGASENSLVDVGNPTDIFGFGAGVLQPGFGVGNAYDTMTVTDSTVSTVNNAFGPLTTVHLNVPSFVQGTPPSASQQAALIVDGGDEAAPQPNGVSDTFNVTPSTNYNIQVNGNLPGLTTVNGVPQGDQLNVAFTGSINVFSDNASPPNVTITGQTASGGSPFGVKFSSIERVNMTPGNGIVNLIGDNNDPAVTQNDYFKVRGGIDPLGNPGLSTNGSNQFSLQIGGSYDPVTGNVGAPPPSGGLSAPIFFYGVTRINASGGEATGFDVHGNAIPQTVGTGVDVLDITPYADNTPRGWGIETYFNEGDPDGDGGQPNPDLLIFNGVFGVSENIVVQPSASMAGQVFDNNAATNTPIAVVNYVLNTNIIVNGSSPAGTAGDTDSLTLRGTDPANPGTSGNDAFAVDLTKAGTAGNELVVVTDASTAAPLYNIQNFTNFNTLNIDTLGGNDLVNVVGRNDGSVALNMSAGDRVNSRVTLLGTVAASDLFEVDYGTNGTTHAFVQRASAASLTPVNIIGFGNVALDGGGGTGTDIVEVFGTTASDVFNVQPLDALNGSIALASSPVLRYSNLGSTGSAVDIIGDAVFPPGAGEQDSVSFAGTAAADVYTYTPSSTQSGALALTTGAATLTFNLFAINNLSVDALDQPGGASDALTLNGTAANDAFVISPATGNGSYASPASPAVSFANFESFTVNGGAGGFDSVEVDGTNADDVVTSTATVVTLVNPVTFGAGLDRLAVNTFDGNDTVTLTTFSAVPTVINAGDGDDQVFGSTQADLIYGGSGSDILIGGGGNDVIYGGAGDDRFGDPLVRDPAANDPGNDQYFGEAGSDQFFWDPGDGNDTIEGGAGDSDQLFFSGNAGAEQFFLFGDTVTPSRFHLFRVQAAINIDAADLEEVNLSTLGGTDTVTVGRSDPGTGSVLSDLSTTTVRAVDVSLGTDGAADNVIVEGRPADDNLLTSVSGGFIKTAGLPYDVRIDGADAALDRLTINGNEGSDKVVADTGVAAFIGLTLNGGTGDDFLSADGNINGNDGNDTLVGGTGNNAMDGGQGDDTFIGNGGTDAIGAGVGSSVGDTILVGGTTGNDTISLGLDALGHLVATVNGLTTTYTNFLGGPIATSGVEQILVQGLAGNDSLTVDSTNGAIPIPINFDGGDDADLLTLTGGTATSDTYSPGPNPGQGTSAIVIGGVTQVVSFSNLEPVIDLVAGPLVVNADNADNAINYSVGRNDTNTADDPTRGRISVDAFETIDFSNKATVTINALAGSDTINVNNPNIPTGLASITVNGGDPTGVDSGADTLIVNSVGRNMVLEPTAQGAGTVTYFGGGFPSTPFTGIESLQLVDTAANPFGIDGTTGNDQFEYIPGATPDTGTVVGTMNSGGAQFPLVPVTFIGMQQAGVVAFNTFGQQGGTDNFVFNGTSVNDNISVANGGVFGGITLSDTVNGSLFANLNLVNMASASVQGHDGDDTFTHDGNVPIPVTYAGGNPSASDVLNFNGNGAAVTVDLAAQTVTDGAGLVSFNGIEKLNIAAGAGAILVNGTANPDNISVTPTSATGATIVPAGLNLTINTTNTSTLTIDPLAGSDTVTVNGTSSADAIAVVRGATTTVQVNALQTVSLPAANTESLIVATGTGVDATTVSGSAGPAVLTVAGGQTPASSTLTVNNTATSGNTTETQGATNDSGTVVNADGTIKFTGLTTVTINDNAASTTNTLTVNGTNGNDTITAARLGASNIVWVNAQAVVVFNGQFNQLTLAGRFGNDSFAVSPVGLTFAGVNPQINVSDVTLGASQLQVNGSAGSDAIGYNPTGATTGNVAITGSAPVVFNNITGVAINGQGGNDNLTVTTVALFDQVTLTPGVAIDAGTVTITGVGTPVSEPPLNYANLGAVGSVSFNSGSPTARQDRLIYNGTSASDTFSVAAATGDVILNSQLVVHTLGVSSLTLAGQDGDDIFNLAGSLPFTGTVLDGGNPSASDIVNLSGATGAVTVNLADSTIPTNTTITGYGGTVTLTGVEVANLNAGASAIGVNGRATAESIAVTPTSASTATITASGLNLTINTTNSAALSIDPLGGGDNLTVYGTQSGETLTVNGTTVVATTSGFKTVTYSSANTENLQVFALAGSDIIDVTPSATTTIFVDGGDPIGNGATPADLIVLHPVGPFSVEPGPESDEGGLFNPPNQRVSWDHIEGITAVGGPGVGPALVMGTNGNDEITVIARDSSYNPALPGVPNPLLDGVQDFTVSVNDGPNVLFINQPNLLIDALAGNDNIVVREPAPNQAVWNVQVYVAGGPPAAGTNALGDKIELETPGTQTVTYNPNNPLASVPPVPGVVFSTPAAGKGQFSDVANTSTVSAVEFLIPLFYASSPGGVEQFVYAGEAGNDTLVYNTPDNTNAGSNLVYTPGANPDAGTITGTQVGGAALTPLTFSNLGTGSHVAFTTSNAGGRTDNLNVEDLPNSVGDRFSVTPANNGTVQITRLQNGNTNLVTLPIFTASVNNLELDGLGGIDTFNLTGALPYTSVTINADATVNLSGAVGPVTIALGDNTPSSPNPNTVITGYGAPVVLVGVDTANLDANAQQVTATGTTQNDNIVFTPTGAAAGTFYNDIPSGNNLVPNTVFNISNTTGNFRVFNDPSGNADQVTLRGTAARDLIEINQGSGVATVLANNVTSLLPVELGISSEILNALGLGGQDTFQIIPAPGIGGQAQDNMLINLDGGASGENNALVIGSSFGAAPGTLAANQFVVVNRGRTDDTGTVRVFTAAVANPDINYKGVQVVVPIAAGTALNPNSLFIGADNFEQNDQLGNAAFLGADSTLQVQHASVFPNSAEFPGVPADQDFYRVVAQTTGTLDFQVYFRTFNPALLPGGGQINLELLDVNGNVVASAPGTFGANPGTGNARIRVPAVQGQSYFLHVFGATATTVNGYDVTIIDTAAPVPTDIELLDTPVNTATNPTTGAPGATAVGVSSDTGRSRFDNITFDNDPTILIRVPNVIQVGGLSFLDDIPANGNAPGAPGNPPIGTILIPFVTSTLTNAPSAGFRVAVFVTERNTTDPVLAGYAQPVAGQPGVFTFTFANDNLAPDGSYFISSSVEMIDPTAPEQNQGFGDLAKSLEAVIDTTLPPASFGSPAVGNDGLILSDECPTPLINLTNVARPTFWGRAEADTVINLYLDSNANGVFDPATDVFLGQTVATPFDGGDQYPNGYWQITSRLSLNDPSLITPTGVLPFDGARTLFITAEDVAGNITGSPTAVVATTLQIVVDTQGPQVTNVQIAGSPAYNLFGLKPGNAPQGPTPLVNSLLVSFQDLPPRVAGTLYNALLDGTVVPGNFHLVGDYNGIIPIQNIILVNNPPVAGSPATATVELVFRTPGPDGVFNTPDDVGKALPDDRFTLTVDDNVTDPLCNALNGESNANEPNGSPNFPSGDEHNGGDFVARFTVDSRPEVGTWGAGAAWIDTNGNTTFDQNNPDFVNRDITYYMGYTSDNLFAGNFVKAAGGVADGFDKLAAYGKVGGSWRFLVDVNNDGVITPGVDIAVVDPAGINGVPVAGDFDGNPANGDEVGIFTGTTWYFDTNHDFKVDLASALPWSQNGYPVVGNFDGVPGDDLATYHDNTFFIDFGRNGTIDKTFRFGFPTPNNRPVSADVDRDGNDDLGLFVPNRAGVSPHEDAEWYILASGGAPITNRIHADPIDGVPVIDFKPVPFGNDLYIQYGDEFGLPILANFDPPVAPGGSTSGSFLSSNPSNPLDVNNDGFVTPIDALLVINEINANGSHALATGGFHTSPFIDTDKDNVVSPHDVLLVINKLNAPPAGSPGAEGEALVSSAAHDEVFGQLGGSDSPAVSDSTDDIGILSLLADDQIRAKRSRQGE